MRLKGALCWRIAPFRAPGPRDVVTGRDLDPYWGENRVPSKGEIQMAPPEARRF